jgi:acyl-CoA synthetase (AMP-forming)/AMP-acid ligase II
LTEADVKGYLEPRLAKYKALNGGVVFIDAIPKTASGKILKRDLRDQAKLEMSSRL